MTRLAALLLLAACTTGTSEDSGPIDSSEDSSTDSTVETGETGDTTPVEAVACTMFDEPDAGTDAAIPGLLSETGCFTETFEAGDTLLPYDLKAPFWSDNATKERWIAMPAQSTISVYADGDFEFPRGTTLVKQFRLDGRKIETRLFVKLSDFLWAGYSYEWNEDQTDAVLLSSRKDVDIGEQTWTYPSRSDCTFCHAAAAGGSLGPEVGQLDKPYTYPDGTTMNQLDKWASMGWFDVAPSDPTAFPVFTDPADTSASLDERARTYLHVNCSQCHRPGGASHLPMDWRLERPLDSATCDAVPNNPGTIVDARILAPGEPERSVIYVRPNTLEWRMPPVGSNVIHGEGVGLIGDWITSITACPPE